MRSVRLTATLGAAALASVAMIPISSSASAATQTMVVNISSVVRPVTHVAVGGLYALATATTPTASELPPLHLNQLVQPAPGVQQLGNGATVPTGDALVVAPLAKSAGAHEYVRMPDIYPNFPYKWVSWSDWLSKVNTMVRARLASSAGSTINGWELWNEPDWTWNTSAAGSFDAGWVTTYNAVRALDPGTPIVGPSTSVYNHAWMSDFVTYAKAHNALPDVISWHELTSWKSIPGDVADYRALERSLGISPRPISIDEYAATADVDVPSAALHYIDNFERSGVTNASRAYWYESGTVNGLLYNNKPTSTYWLYKWYGDMTGNMVAVTASDYEDGIASYNSSTKTVNVIFGGETGNNNVRIDGLGALGSSVKVVLSYAPSLGRKTNLAAPTTMSTTTYAVSNGSITVPFTNQDYLGAYQIVVTPTSAGGGSTTSAVRNVNSGLCLDDYGWTTTDGAAVDQWTCNGYAVQQWTFDQLSNGYYNLINGNSASCLDDPGGSSTPGTAADLWDCNGSTPQQWSVTDVGSGVFELVNRASGLCLDDYGWSTTAGATADLWTCNGLAVQRWTHGWN